jgi:hypothetical protein
MSKNPMPWMFFYLRINNWTAGSVYKYHTLLLKRFGGLLIGRESKTSMGALISKHNPDLMFCHGDWLLDYQIPLSHGIPYVLFQHDIHSLRADLNPQQKRYERVMLESAAGIVFTSEDHQKYINKHFNVTDNQQVIHLRPLQQNLAWLPMPKLPGKHLVYAGGIVRATGSNYGYRSYHDIFKDFMDAGWTVHVYPANEYMETTTKSYKDIGCKVYKKQSYNTLLQKMSQYTAGLQSYTKHNVPERAFNYTQTCRPNKVWDYLAAGIPTIGLYPGNCARIYQDGGWGIVIPDTKRSTLDNLVLPEFDADLRFQQVMDTDTSKFDTVIRKALGKEPKKIETTDVVDMEGDGNVPREGKYWFRLEKPVMEHGRLLHGRGKRIPVEEAIRLGLVKKEEEVKKDLKKKRERKKKEKAKEEVKKVDIEVKPLIEPPEKKEAHVPHRISVPATLEVTKPTEDKEEVKDEEKERDN